MKLYPFSVLEKRRVVNDTFDGKKVVIVYDAEGMAGAAFLRGKHTFSWKDGKMLDEKGREWDLFHGKRDKESLERLAVADAALDTAGAVGRPHETLLVLVVPDGVVVQAAAARAGALELVRNGSESVILLAAKEDAERYGFLNPDINVNMPPAWVKVGL